MSILHSLFRKKQAKANESNLPVHIAIIPDGNGRWAKKRGLPRSAGHKQGSYTLKRIVKFSNNLGIKYLTIFTFSTENWKRPKSEVEALMTLLLEFLRNAEKELEGANVRIRVIGDVKKLSEELQTEIARVEKLTADNDGLVLNIALNYGGRDEILHAVKDIAEDVGNGRLKLEDINDILFSSRLYTAGIPDPDLLIRTSGEKRASNFLLWQLSYAEFWYTDVLWPDFQESDLLTAIDEFKKRNRRYGGV